MIEKLKNDHWNVDGKTHGDVNDAHVKVSVDFAIDILKNLYYEVIREDLHYTLSSKGKEGGARKIEKKIGEIKKLYQQN